MLEGVGTREDVPRLRGIARRLKPRARPDLGLALARRVADRVFVEDQGRVVLRIGSRAIDGTSIRRKVLGLLCFLLSRPDRSATRDEVLDAMWPDLEPEVALNSLNQTLYFLRRVFEPHFKEETSPGYVHHESDVVWLDSELIDSRTIRCASLIREASRAPSIEHAEQLSRNYRGKFAQDFAYEPWSSAYRDSLHAAYLSIIERVITERVAAGDFSPALILARRAIEVDPEAEEMELSLLRVYRHVGATAAASEQYGHYASALREALGIDPPRLEDV
jgi:DNA-binding SARP family transcriptional activator